MSSSGSQDWAESLYYHIAKDAVRLARDIAARPASDETEFERKKSVATTIVFSALCLEAFINRQYFEHGHTPGRDTKKNWLELPQRINPANKGLDENSKLLTTFKELLNFRNKRLVHFTPKREGSASVPAAQRDWAEVIGDVSLAETYVECIREMVDELRLLTQGKTPPASILEKKYTRSVWASSP